jgi:hypothetical protein
MILHLLAFLFKLECKLCGISIKTNEAADAIQHSDSWIITRESEWRR